MLIIELWARESFCKPYVVPVEFTMLYYEWFPVEMCRTALYLGDYLPFVLVAACRGIEFKAFLKDSGLAVQFGPDACRQQILAFVLNLKDALCEEMQIADRGFFCLLAVAPELVIVGSYNLQKQ